MKNVMKALIMAIAMIVGVGMAGAVDVNRPVTATVTIQSYLDFQLNKTSVDLGTLGPTLPSPSVRQLSGNITSTGDWAITKAISGDHSGCMIGTGQNYLHAALGYDIDNINGAPMKNGPVLATFSQAYTSNPQSDYAGTYTATVTFTASTTF